MRRGVVASRVEARELIEAGQVTVNGAPAGNPRRVVSAQDAVARHDPPSRFVSRGGAKLEAALAAWSIDVAGQHALDAGASTGGFTDCLLQRGAASVVCVDVGRGQLHERLRRHERVFVLDRTNIRTVAVDDVPGAPFPLVVADLSFISLRSVAPVLAGGMAAPGATIVILVKPQFEANRADASRSRGVIREPAIWSAALEGVASAFEGAQAAIMGAMVSPLTGADGNVEFLLHAVAHGPAARQADLDAVVAAAATTAALGSDR